MTARRIAAILLTGSAPAAPPGIDPAAYARALLDDVVTVVEDLATVECAIAVTAGADRALAESVAGRTVPVLAAADVVGALDALAALGATDGAVLAADVPDIPRLVVAKLFSALEDAPTGVCPAPGGTLAGLSARLPVPGWLRAAAPDLDAVGALDGLHAAAPRRSVVVGPGWHRLRAAADVRALDPGLEGYAATRGLLSVPRRPEA